MDLHDIDLNLLVHLDALLTERHVTRASKRVGLSQSAMSRALGRLRELFDDDLLVKTAGGMEPTRLSLKLAPRVRRILSDIARTIEEARPFVPEESTRAFTIVVDDVADALCTPTLLATLAELAPLTSARLVSAQGERLDLALVDAPADLAIGAIGSAREEVALVDLARIPLVVAARTGSALLGAPQSASELSALARAALETDDALERALRAAGHPPGSRARARVSSLRTLCDTLATTELIAAVPEPLIERDARLSSLHVVDLDARATLRVAWRSGLDDAATSWLRQRIIALFSRPESL